ncbi:hypothetical protein [Marinobacterium arenosum]|uniref:hypothetical protein n=1 Tax=Marinobacterium arenosum TaxID=2862496 RepID=UPI001C95C983|nr:hypothetical protein [Marinobacterium arenosum]MBY4677915.1 hypothetical protein [Marinobacterium arenosum]
MNQDKTVEWLSSLTAEQLDRVQQALVQKIAEQEALKAKEAQEKQAAQANQKKVAGMPPTRPNDVEALASMQGLDISGLMREISKR